MFVSGLHSYLAANAGMQAVLGTSRSDGADGLFAAIAPSSVIMPYVVYLQISGDPERTMDGVNNLFTGRWRFQCYGGNYKQAKSLAAALKAAINGLFETVNEGTQVQGAWQVMETDTTEAVPKGTIWATHVDFEIIWAE